MFLLFSVCPTSAHIKVRLCEASKRHEKNENHVVYPKLRQLYVGRDNRTLLFMVDVTKRQYKTVLDVTDGHENHHVRYRWTLMQRGKFDGHIPQD